MLNRAAPHSARACGCRPGKRPVLSGRQSDAVAAASLRIIRAIPAGPGSQALRLPHIRRGFGDGERRGARCPPDELSSSTVLPCEAVLTAACLGLGLAVCRRLIEA